MYLHLADTSNDRGQYALLLDSDHTRTLASYHYLDRSPGTRRDFERLWSEQMRLHLVSWPSQKPQSVALRDSGHRDHLMSYALKEEEKHYRELWETREGSENDVNLHLAGRMSGPMHSVPMIQTKSENHLATYGYERATRSRRGFPAVWNAPEMEDTRPRVIVDSGAFTAFTTGQVIPPEKYGTWALHFAMKWQEKMAALHFMNLDVIGDQVASWENQKILEDMGLSPIPIITYGADLRHLNLALEEYDYIALGGLVPHSRNRKRLQAWLDRCFREVMRHREATGLMRKIHLLGITQAWALNRYPCYSSDSSSWTKPLRFGGGEAAGLGRLPKYKAGDGEMSATLNALRGEIRRMQEMERHATELWRSRGIEWEEGR